MKLRLMAAFGAALILTATASAQDAPDKNKLSYAIGYEIGRDFTEKNFDVDLATVIRAIQDGYAKRDPAVPEAEMRAELAKMQQRMMEAAKAEFEKVAAENKAKADRFLAENRGKKGVTVLPSGVQYRVIEEGNGARPTANSNVKVHFRGSLAGGLEFASTYTGNEPVSLKVAEAPLPGLREVLPLMKAGSRWELFLPPDQAYGMSPRPVGPSQAVVFDVTLVSVE